MKIVHEVQKMENRSKINRKNVVRVLTLRGVFHVFFIS